MDTADEIRFQEYIDEMRRRRTEHQEELQYQYDAEQLIEELQG